MGTTRGNPKGVQAACRRAISRRSLGLHKRVAEVGECAPLESPASRSSSNPVIRLGCIFAYRDGARADQQCLSVLREGFARSNGSSGPQMVVDAPFRAAAVLRGGSKTACTPALKAAASVRVMP